MDNFRKHQNISSLICQQGSKESGGVGGENIVWAYFILYVWNSSNKEKLNNMLMELNHYILEWLVVKPTLDIT